MGAKRLIQSGQSADLAVHEEGVGDRRVMIIEDRIRAHA